MPDDDYTFDETGPYDEILPDSLEPAEEARILIRLLAKDVQKLVGNFTETKRRLREIEGVVKNGGLEEITEEQEELLNELDKKQSTNIEAIKVLENTLQLLRDIAVPIIYFLGGTGILWMIKKLFFSELF